MKNIPSKIFLNISGVNVGEEYDFRKMGGVTWCTDRINDTDVAYVKDHFPNVRNQDVFNFLAGEFNITPTDSELSELIMMCQRKQLLEVGFAEILVRFARYAASMTTENNQIDVTLAHNWAIDHLT